MKPRTASLKVLGLLSVLGVLVITGPAAAQVVRIVAADGAIHAEARIGEIRVRPGQVVSLTADEVWRNHDGETEFAFRPVEDFIWSVAEMGGDRCDPEQGCEDSLWFEVTEYGVNFYVPWDAPEGMRITARLRWGRGFDSVTLVNRHARDGYDRPYWDSYLSGLGHWVPVGGTLVFVPVHHSADWAPYRHGHWYWSVHGWTWYSYDPWGYVTDHCGHWRHSILYGWVWVPETVCHWRPSVVSFFHGPTWIGWYPFDPGWHRGYRQGYADGYDDGFWTGLWVGQRLGRKGRLSVHPGLTMVTYKHFYKAGKGHHGNMSKVMVTDEVASHKAFNDAVRKGHVSPIPGGGKVPAAGRQFIADRIGVRPVEVKMLPAWDDGKKRRGMKSWKVPDGSGREIPDRYRTATRKSRDAMAGARTKPDRGRLTRTGGDEGGKGPAARPRIRRKSRSRTLSWEPREHAGNVDPARSRKESRRETRKARDTGAREGKPLYDFQGTSRPVETRKPTAPARLRPHEDRSVGRPPAATNRIRPAPKVKRTEPKPRPTRVPDRWQMNPREKPEPLRPRPRARPERKKVPKASTHRTGGHRKVRKVHRPAPSPAPKRSVSRPAPAYKPSKKAQRPKKAERPKKPERRRRVQSPPRSRPSMDRPVRNSSDQRGRPSRRR